MKNRRIKTIARLLASFGTLLLIPVVTFQAGIAEGLFVFMASIIFMHRYIFMSDPYVTLRYNSSGKKRLSTMYMGMCAAFSSIIWSLLTMIFTIIGAAAYSRPEGFISILVGAQMILLSDVASKKYKEIQNVV